MLIKPFYGSLNNNYFVTGFFPVLLLFFLCGDVQQWPQCSRSGAPVCPRDGFKKIAL